MKYKVGMKVRFNDDYSHNEFPEYYPKVGAIGEIVECFDVDCLIQWPNNSTSGKDEWYCEYKYLDIVEENYDMTDREIYDMLKDKMRKNGIKKEGVFNVFYNEYMLIKAVSLAYTVGYKRAKKGRPFKYGDNK